MNDGIDPKVKSKIIAVLNALVPEAKIYLYGSRAKGTHAQWSDIDLALDAGCKLDQLEVGEARDMLEASNMPYKVDVVDINSVSQNLRDEILKDRVLWKK